MTKSLMISIQPQHAFNILYRKKTLELRTWIPKGYVGWVYVYVTKGKFVNGLRRNQDIVVNNNLDLLNGKVAFRFWFDEYAELNPNNFFGENVIYYEQYDNIYPDEDIEQSGVIDVKFLEKVTQVSLEDMQKYSKGKYIYAWHIKKLEVFDEPKELSDFYVTNKGLSYIFIKAYEERTNDNVAFRLKKAPQRSVWVYTKENEK